MGRLLILFLAMPWWAFFPVAIGAGLGGEFLYKEIKADEEVRAAAVNMAPPALVDLAEFDREAHITEAKEVNVSGWADSEHNYVLEIWDGAKLEEEFFLFLMFGSDQNYDSREVRAALVLEEHELDLFYENFDNYVVGEILDGEAVVALNGLASRSHSEGSMVNDAIADEGLVKSENFVYIAPFWEGREAGLTSNVISDKVRLVFWVFAGFAMLVGVAKRWMKTQESDGRNADGSLTFGKPAAKAKPKESWSPATATRAQASPLASGIDPSSPIGRMAAARAEAAGANQHDERAEQKISAHIEATSKPSVAARPARVSIFDRLRGADQSPVMANVRRVMIVGVVAFAGYQVLMKDGLGLTTVQDFAASEDAVLEAPVVDAKMTALEAAQAEVAAREAVVVAPVAPAPEAVSEPVVAPETVTRVDAAPSQMPLIPSNLLPDDMMPTHLLPGMVPAAASLEAAPVEVAPVEVAVVEDTPAAAPAPAPEQTANSMVSLVIKLMLGAALLAGLWRLTGLVRANMGSRQKFCPDEVMGMPREEAAPDAASDPAMKAVMELAPAAHERTAHADRLERPARAPRRINVQATR